MFDKRKHFDVYMSYEIIYLVLWIFYLFTGLLIKHQTDILSPLHAAYCFNSSAKVCVLFLVLAPQNWIAVIISVYITCCLTSQLSILFPHSPIDNYDRANVILSVNISDNINQIKDLRERLVSHWPARTRYHFGHQHIIILQQNYKLTEHVKQKNKISKCLNDNIEKTVLTLRVNLAKCHFSLLFYKFKYFYFE